MMLFAKIGLNNKVIDTVTVADSDCQDANNKFDENIGVQFLEKLTQWPLWVADVDGRFSAGVGKIWDETNQIFKHPKPFDSWNFNYSTGEYDPPIDYPSDYDTVKYLWNEDNQSWDEL